MLDVVLVAGAVVTSPVDATGWTWAAGEWVPDVALDPDDVDEQAASTSRASAGVAAPGAPQRRGEPVRLHGSSPYGNPTSRADHPPAPGRPGQSGRDGEGRSGGQ